MQEQVSAQAVARATVGVPAMRPPVMVSPANGTPLMVDWIAGALIVIIFTSLNF